MTEQIAITCPHCAFHRSVPPEMIPDGAKQATCPKCNQPFPLNAQTVSLHSDLVTPGYNADSPYSG